VITVRVTDDGAPALSDTRSFTVVVNEVNNAPVLTPIPDQIVAAGNQLMIVNSATDSDVPKNILTFSLDSDAPPGAVIDPASGLLTWTPETNPGPGTNTVTVRVTDNGVPNLSDARPVNIIVVSRPVIESIVVLDDRVTLTWTAIPGRTYRVQFQTEPGQLIWSDLKGDVTAEGWDAAVSDLVLPTTQRFYRIALLP
jgi:hypothetical protein